MALVQGGGPQGTRAWNTDEREVFERHLEASELVEPPVDLVVWPEDVVDVEELASSEEDAELADLARDLDTTLVAGIVEDAGAEHFTQLFGRLRRRRRDRRPLRQGPPGALRRVRPAAVAARALRRRRTSPPGTRVIGERPAQLSTPAGELSVAISWEIFFGDRVREGVEDGAELVLNPTNGSSFTGTLVQTQQVAASRMRAIESDRALLQVAPTGFSAIIGPDGTVEQRTAVSEQTVLHGTVELRSGTTPYTRLGYGPAVAVALVSLAVGWLIARRRRGPDARPGHGRWRWHRGGRGSDVEDERDGAVVHEGEAHVGPEPPGRHLSPEPS